MGVRFRGDRADRAPIRFVLAFILCHTVSVGPRIMYTFRYQPLTGAPHLIFSHGVLHILLYKGADAGPSFLDKNFFLSILRSYPGTCFWSANIILPSDT